MIGWLPDTNVISTIINPNGAPTIKAWAATQNESRSFLSILTLAEYDKGVFNLPDDHPNRPRFIAARDGTGGPASLAGSCRLATRSSVAGESFRGARSGLPGARRR